MSVELSPKIDALADEIADRVVEKLRFTVGASALRDVVRVCRRPGCEVSLAGRRRDCVWCSSTCRIYCTLRNPELFE